MEGAAAMGNSMEFLRQFKLELLYNPAILLLDIYFKKIKTTIWMSLEDVMLSEIT